MTPWTVAHQVPSCLWDSQYWSGLTFAPPGDPPDPGIELVSPVSSALAGRLFYPSAIWEARCTKYGPMNMLVD